MNTSYKAWHILLEDEEDALYIKEQLQSGESFQSLAREYSECESGAKGGDLGRFSSGVMDAAFERALYHLEVGEISAPVRTKYGYHIIKRVE
ncbi:MAG: hypothetical protein CME62_07055 [Halobacteriovoraceae bacterium]|nr:hypothetical protein [Halobacteriovoraceae bacterium]|tara:strand:+ start:10354 stop:10629 length:276 start_codon:yes stop_codon:yes gene_type:complete